METDLAMVEDPVFHMDYSENLQITPKFEPQSSHFVKRQFSLHCTVFNSSGDEGERKFVYHLSDDTGHDVYFTMAVIKDLIQRYCPHSDVIRFKSDNCSIQQKCGYVFYEMILLAVLLRKIFIVYYGIAGHGKGLVDAMSGFGVKTPLRKAVVTNDFHFKTSKVLQEFLQNLHTNSDRDYHNFDHFERKPKVEWNKLIINGFRKQHIIAYFSDGNIYSSRKTYADVKIAFRVIW